MHLSPSAVADAIRLLDGAGERGDICGDGESLISKVSLMFVSWNQIGEFLRKIDGLRRAA